MSAHRDSQEKVLSVGISSNVTCRSQCLPSTVGSLLQAPAGVTQLNEISALLKGLGVVVVVE